MCGEGRVEMGACIGCGVCKMCVERGECRVFEMGVCGEGCVQCIVCVWRRECVGCMWRGCVCTQ